MTKFQINQRNVLKTKVMDWNAAYFRRRQGYGGQDGVDIYEWMKRAGRGIAQTLNAKFKIQNAKLKIAFFCGPGNNGGDGFAAARFLDKKKFEPVVFLFGSPQDIRTEEARRHWEEMKGKGVKTRVIASPAKRDEAISLSRGLLPPTLRRGRNDDKGFDIVVDCLLGTGAKGRLREPIASAVRLFSKIRAYKVVVDAPTPGIKKFDLAISMQFPKVEGAEVVKLETPSSSPPISASGAGGENVLSRIGPGEVKALNLPRPGSHKGDNGRLLIIAGSEQYYGALLYTIKAASKIVDLIYVLSTPENLRLIEKLKSKTAEFITISDSNLRMHANDTNYDCILIGPGMGQSKRTYNLVKAVLKSKKKAVLDADALNVMDEKLLKLMGPKYILTPHRSEFKRLSKNIANAKNLDKFVKQYNCTVVLKGKVDIVGSPEQGLRFNYTGNQGMTKGGTGDVLAGLVAGFYCKNDAYLSAAAGVFVNGLAGDELYKKVGTFYNAEDLLGQIPKTMYKIISTPS